MPAPVLEHHDTSARGYIIQLHRGMIASEEAPRLANRYRLKLRWVYHNLPAFSAEFPPEVMAQLRCDPSVESISYNVREPELSGRGKGS